MNQSPSQIKMERRAILIVALIQFVNVVDFMMVMPLGPDLAKALSIRVSHMGVMAGAYTLSAAISGLIGSFFLDRLSRRTALVWSVAGLALGTAAGAFAFDFQTLLWARVLAGLFGGPTTSVGLSIIADLVPHERRGASIGKVMIGFSAASILGVPIGLELARVGGWNAPFIMIGIGAALMALAARCFLPVMDEHLSQIRSESILTSLRALINKRMVWMSYLLLGCVMMSGFLIFPNIAGFVQMNLHFPREDMGELYFIGGLASLLAMSFTGKLVDRFGSVPWFFLGSIGFLLAMIFGLYFSPPVLNPFFLFVGIMVFGTFRNISMQTLASKVPNVKERASYMSLQSAVQHASMAAGGIASSRILTTTSEGELDGMQELVFTSGIFVVVAAALIVVLWKLVQKHEH